jgi:hypothetical protein
LGAKKSFATFGYVIQKLHYFNQQKLHGMQNCHFYLDNMFPDTPLPQPQPPPTITDGHRVLATAVDDWSGKPFLR